MADANNQLPTSYAPVQAGAQPDIEANDAVTEKDTEAYEEKVSPSSSHISEAGHDETNPNDGGNVQKVTSKVSVNNMASIPNGGLRAWLQVIGAFMLFFNTWGIVNTYGTYQTFYEKGTLFKSSSSNLSWIGAVQAFLLLFVGAITGPIYDAGYFRFLLVSGSFLTVFGQMMLSLCTEYYQAFLAQAICIGLGSGLLFVPSVAIISTYFTTKIAFAIGLAASGSSLGGVVYPIVFHKLEPQIGFRWTTRIIGFVILVTLIIPNIVMKVRVLPAERRKLFDVSAWKYPPYPLYVFGCTIAFAGLYVPFFYIQYYAIATGITGESFGFYLISILNAASVVGRILPNFLADKIGPINILVPCAISTSVLIFACLGIHHIASVIVFCILYGFFSGAFVSLPPAIFVSLSPSRGVVGTRMGMGFTIISLGVLVGTPVAGAILGYGSDVSELNFVGIWAFGGSLTGVGAVMMILAKIAKGGFTITKKV